MATILYLPTKQERFASQVDRCSDEILKVTLRYPMDVGIAAVHLHEVHGLEHSHIVSRESAARMVRQLLWFLPWYRRFWP